MNSVILSIVLLRTEGGKMKQIVILFLGLAIICTSCVSSKHNVKTRIYEPPKQVTYTVKKISVPERLLRFYYEMNLYKFYSKHTNPCTLALWFYIEEGIDYIKEFCPYSLDKRIALKK